MLGIARPELHNIPELIVLRTLQRGEACNKLREHAMERLHILFVRWHSESPPHSRKAIVVGTVIS